MVSDKQRIMELEERLDYLENELNMMKYRIDKFMKKWGPDVQKRRDERDAIWDEMVRVVSIQNKNKER